MSLESISWYSEKTGFTRETCAKRLSEVPSQPGPKAAKLYDTKLALPALFDAPHGGQQMDLARERAMLAKSQRTKLDMEIDVMRGRLLPADKVELVWTAMVMAFRAKMLAVPSRMAAVAVSCPSPADAENVLRDAVEEALSELAAYDVSQYSSKTVEQNNHAEPSGHDDDSAISNVSKQTPKKTPKRKPRNSHLRAKVPGDK